ncbi:MAG: aminotransferase class I/II-fold pyridoxal phosphate-dependent enzyme, partial [candidate division Zixibacteria bacterium]
AIIKEIYKVKLPFELNYPAQIAAQAALYDDDFLKQTVETNRKSLAELKACFDKLGIKHMPTAANFMLILFPSEQFSTAFNEQCLEHGLIVRHLKSFGIPEAIRINSGTEDETEFAVSVIEKVYEKLSEQFGIEYQKTVRT